MLQSMDRYTPSQVVEKTGFSLDTLRYYERIGLLTDVDRTVGGRRVYSEDHVNWLGLLRCLRDTGMPISRMLYFADLCRSGPHTVPERVRLLEEHDAAVDEKIATLNEQRRRVQGKIGWYRQERRLRYEADAHPDSADNADTSDLASTGQNISSDSGAHGQLNAADSRATAAP